MRNEAATARPVAEFDESAFWALYEEALPRIYGFLRRRTDQAIAEDLTQEVFSTMARAMTTEGTEPSMSWLFAVARSRLYDHLRALSREQRNREAVLSRRSPIDLTVEQTYESRHLDERIQRALESLPTAQRAALVMHHLDDATVAEVAERIGRSVAATESLLARARRAFRAAFEEDRHG